MLLRGLAARTLAISANARRAASSASRMVEYKKFGDLSVHPSLVAFVEKDVLPGVHARRPQCRWLPGHSPST